MKVDCPHCKQNAETSFSGVSYSYPSHGGEYEWKETGGTATCSACKKSYEVRVTIDLDTMKIYSAKAVK